MIVRPATARWLVLALIVAAARRSAAAPADEEGGTPPPAGEPPPATAPAESADIHRPLGPPLFPFYQHYLRTADSTTVRNILYLYASTDNPNGSWSRLLVPFFYREHSVAPPRDLLYLFPLLFFHKDSPEESFNLAIPFYFERGTPAGFTRLLLPFWHQSETPERLRHHVLFPLFRYTEERSSPENPLVATRLGLWKILELWESRVDSEHRDRAVLNFFNWRQEAQGGLPVYRSSWQGQGEAAQGKTHLFPFYWHGREGASRHLWVLPFFGEVESQGGSDLYFPLLLSSIGGGSGGERSLNILFPFFHYSESPKTYSIASYPFFDYSRDETGTSSGILFWLYRTRWLSETGKRTHSILFPLSHFDVEPDGSRGDRWFFPYIETFDSKALWRFVLPLYFERQSLAGGETDYFFRVALPVGLSFGSPRDYFTMVFPLFWASRDGPRGWETFFPIYWQLTTASSQRLHIVPFVSYRSFPSRKQLFVGGPLYIHERFYDHRGELSGTGHNFLWPFVRIESRNDGYNYRLLPLFSASRSGDTRGLLITPLFFQETGPRGTHRYFFPVYGRFDDGRIERDYYAAATYIRTVEKDETGDPIRKRSDILFSLAGWESDLRSGGEHRHVLPVGYWETRSPAVDRTVAGPFYYSHRIREGEEESRLSLVAGNLFLSRTSEGPLSVEEPGAATAAVVTPGAAPVKADAAPDGADAATPGTTAGEAATVETAPRRGETYRDQGILWPMSRWYRSAGGESGSWVIPFYFDIKSDLKQNRAIFPLYFEQEDRLFYDPTFFRFFFLYDRETWRGGHRSSVGQVIFDWKAEESAGRYRVRFLYPLLEHSWGEDGYRFNFTPLLVRSRKERTVDNHLFPVYWRGGTERRSATGEWRSERRHFYLLPLYGFEEKGHRRDQYFLFPLMHVRTSRESIHFELWPVFFYRDEPGIGSVKLWPLHADESGPTAGEFWVSRFLFLSKRFDRPDSWKYRFDPFIFRASEGPDSFGIAGLFELFAYNRRGDSSSYRAIPLLFGSSRGDSSSMGVIPFHYRRDFGKEEIDYMVPWRFFFLTHWLRGASGERHFGVLWKLFEHTDNPNRPDFHEVKFLERVFFKRSTETSSQLELNPFFATYRDETRDETEYSILLSLYRYRKVRGQTTHTIFFFLHF
jgi:hypothetical protein